MLRLIIVEDEEIIRRGLVCTVDWLSMDCVVVGEAEDGQAGLELLARERPDVVLTDIRMPKLDGIAMAEAAREQGILPRLVFLTSYAEFDYAKKAIELQAADYLLKPVEEEALARLMARLNQEKGREKSRESQTGESKPDLEQEAKELIDWQAYLQADNLNPYVRTCLERIRRDFRERLSIELLAEELQVSPSYLSRKFKESCTQTFGELLTKQRLRHAVKQLATGTYRVYEVAEQNGFGDYKNFCVVFKKYLHVSPREFMNRLGGIWQQEDKQVQEDK